MNRVRVREKRIARAMERSGIAARLLGSPGPGYFNTDGGRPPTWDCTRGGEARRRRQRRRRRRQRRRRHDDDDDDGAAQRDPCIRMHMCACSCAHIHTRDYIRPLPSPVRVPRLCARPSRPVHTLRVSYGFTRSFGDEKAEREKDRGPSAAR